MRPGAIEQQPGDPRVARQPSPIARLSGDSASDRRLAEEAINGHASDPHLLTAHCAILQRQGRLEEALAVYDRALALTPDCAEAHAGRGAVLLQQKLLEEALAALDQAVRCSAGGVLRRFTSGVVSTTPWGNPAAS